MAVSLTFHGNKVDFVPGVIISKELQPREELKKKFII